MEDENGERRERIRRIDYVYRLTITLASLLGIVAVGITGWTANQVMTARAEIHDIEKRVIRIEATEFRLITDELKARLDKIPEQYPPQWLLDKVDNLERRLESIEDVIIKKNR